MDTSILIQKQVRDNSQDLNFYMKDLYNWEDDIKRKEANLDSEEVSAGDMPPVRSKRFKKINKDDKSKHSRIKSGDYSAWDKFDVDAACEEVDKEEDQDYIEVEDDPTDDEKHRLFDEAYFEKEKGNIFVKDKKWVEAIKCYTKAIDNHKSDPIFYANRALCYLKLQKFSSAEIDCTSALRLEPNYVKALQRRAAAKIALNQLNEAFHDLKEVLELEPNNRESMAEMVKLEKRLSTRNKTTNVAPKIVQPQTSKQNETSVADCKSENTKPKIIELPDELTINSPQVQETGETVNVEKKTETQIINDWKQQREECRQKMITEEAVIWPGGNDHTFIKPIKKPPHLRSKKPLKRIQIMEVDSSVDQPTPATTQLDAIKPLVDECKPPSVADEPVIEIPYPAPKTCLQFVTSWKTLKGNLVRKFEYLISIGAKELPNIFQEFLESDLLSEMLFTLSENCSQTNPTILYNYMNAFTNVQRFSTMIMFMGKTDKDYIKKIVDYIATAGELSPTDLQNLKKHYEL